ncbi:hypothetical protein [Kribbella deserti]|uniref:DUF2690 domain-containing protein n=1 Tax=Kribbella deserti TaxID=1926257 RepID=A0ABV6QJR5_9ACTN
MSVWSKFRKASVAALVFGVVSVAGTNQQALAAGCYGSTCDNKGPVSMGCTSDTVKVLGTPAGGVALAYSKACNAYWAYSTSAPNWYDATVYIERSYYDAGTKLYKNVKRLQITFSPGEESEWTNMLGSYGPANEAFRGLVDWNDPSYPGIEATRWHCHKKGCPPWL